MPKKQKKNYLQTYRPEWALVPILKDWIEPVESDDGLAYCKCCGVKLTAHYNSLLQHANTKKHQSHFEQFCPDDQIFKRPFTPPIIKEDDETFEDGENVTSSELLMICRTCMKKCPVHTTVSVSALDEELGRLYSDIISKITGVRVECTDVLCAKCRHKAQEAYKFRLQAQNVDVKIKNDFENIAVKCEPVEYNIDFDPEDFYFDNDNDEFDYSEEVKKNQCTMCKESFGTSLALLTHIRTAHPTVMEIKKEINYEADSFDQVVKKNLKKRGRKPKDKLEIKKVKSSNNTRSTGMKNLHIPVLPLVETHDEFEEKVMRSDLVVHRCSVCSEVFKDMSELEQHCHTHSETELIMCSLCERCFVQYHTFKMHFAVHHPELTDIIDADATTTILELQDTEAAEKILHHVRMTTIGDYIAANVEQQAEPMEIEAYVQTCGLCGVVLLSEEQLQHHNSTEHPDFNSRCYICAKSFYLPHSVKTHIRKCNTADLKAVCVICNRKFSRITRLSIHVKNDHSELYERWKIANCRIYDCNICNTPFSQEKDYIDHKLSCAPQTVECDHCGKTFKTKESLKAHIRRVTGPPMEKTRLCSICGAKFALNKTLVQHMRTHTGDYPYKCNLCPKSFATTHAHKYHMRGHTGDSPHVCGHCGKRFIRPVSLRLHMLIHSGEKPHKCEICGAGFVQSYGLIQHKNRHHPSERQAHACSLCNAAYIKPESLVTHMMKHHKKMKEEEEEEDNDRIKIFFESKKDEKDFKY